MGRFVIHRTASGYKFDLKASNGEVVATSEVYSARAACVKGARSVAKCAAGANYADLTGAAAPVGNPKFELYTDRNGNFRFRLRARNGQIIATSEPYRTKGSCEKGIDSVRNNAAEAFIDPQP